MYSMDKNLEEIRDIVKKTEISSVQKKKKGNLKFQEKQNTEQRRYSSDIKSYVAVILSKWLETTKAPVCMPSAEWQRGPYNWKCNKGNVIMTLSSAENSIYMAAILLALIVF